MPPKRSELRREAVRMAAAELFLDRGYSETSIQDIADRLDLPRASAYHYMQSKEEILYDIVMAGISGLIERLDHIQGYPLAPKDKVRLAILDNMRAVTGDPFTALSVARPADLSALTPEHAADHQAMIGRYVALFFELLESAMEAGEFRKAGHPKVVGYAILGMIHHLKRWYRKDGDMSIEQIADVWWEFINQGLDISPVLEPVHQR